MTIETKFMAKLWLITGSASGFGRDVAGAALAAGNRVVLTARRPEELQGLVQQNGNNVRAVRHDVTNSWEADAAVGTAIGAFGRLRSLSTELKCQLTECPYVDMVS